VGTPGPTTGVTVAEYVMAFAVAEAGWTDTAVVVSPTFSHVAPEDAVKLASPEYVPVTSSTPTGALSEAHEPVSPTRVIMHNGVVPTVMATEPVGMPAPETVAEYVTGWPEDTEWDSTDTSVEVGVPDTDSDEVPEELVKLESPEYVPVTVSVPPGALVDEHEPLPPTRVATQSGLSPTANPTVPVGVPVPAAGVTVAEYVTGCPACAEGPLTETAVTEAGPTLSGVVPVDAEKLGSPEYVPVTVRSPEGESLDEQEPVPASRVAMHNAVEPSVNVTVPVGVPTPTPGVTVAENVTCWPGSATDGPAEIAVVVSPTAKDPVAEEPIKLPSPE
jgi:hypothetical protein